MLTVEIGYRTALPIRAIPFCSHGSISALDVAEFLSNPEWLPGEFDERTYEDPDHPLTKYDHPPAAFRIDELGKVEKLPPGVFHSTPKNVARAMELTDPVAPVMELPRGIFVWLDEIRVLFDYLDFQLTRQEHNARGSVEHFREWQDEPLLPMGKATFEIVMEGVAHAVQTTTRKTVKRSGPGGTDPHIQAMADAEAKLFRDQNNRFPTKEEVAKKVASKTHKALGTVMRETTSPKKRLRD